MIGKSSPWFAFQPFRPKYYKATHADPYPIKSENWSPLRPCEESALWEISKCVLETDLLKNGFVDSDVPVVKISCEYERLTRPAELGNQGLNAP